jgi:hypothetical protein
MVWPSQGIASRARTEQHRETFSGPALCRSTGIHDVAAKDGGVGVDALRFALLTTARTGEVFGTIWDEIDITGKVWTVPGHRTLLPESNEPLVILPSPFQQNRAPAQSAPTKDLGLRNPSR